MRHHAWTEIEAGSGQDLGDDGVVDVDVQGSFARHGSPQNVIVGPRTPGKGNCRFLDSLCSVGITGQVIFKAETRSLWQGKARPEPGFTSAPTLSYSIVRARKDGTSHHRHRGPGG